MKTSRYGFSFSIEQERAPKVFISQGRRQKRVKFSFLAVFLVLLIWSLVFINGIVSWASVLEDVGLRTAPVSTEALPFPETGGTIQTRAVRARSTVPYTQNCGTKNSAAASGGPSQISSLRVFAHLSNEIEWAHLSLEADCGVIQVVAPEWISITARAGGIDVKLAEASERQAVSEKVSASNGQLQLLPIVEFPSENTGDGLLQGLLSPTSREKILQELVAQARFLKAGGLCLDLSQFPPEKVKTLGPFLEDAATAFAQEELESCLIVEAQQTFWKVEPALQLYDLVVLKIFQTPWLGSPPSPLAAQAWFRKQLAEAVALIGTERLIPAIGNFAVEWVSGEPLPRAIPFAEAMSLIAKHGGDISFGRDVSNSYSRFLDENRRLHSIWMLDAASLFNEVKLLEEFGVQNMGVWSLGMEDPGIWPMLSGNFQSPQALIKAIAHVALPDYVHYEGEGAFLKVASNMRAGKRQIVYDDASNRIIGQTYSTVPQPEAMIRYGQPAPNQLILTFDDGPHPDYTLQILDILRETNTPAAFFLVGANVLQAPDLVERMLADGHEIGSHTFSHPRMDLVPNSRLEAEYNSFQRLLAGNVERTTMLYREPFLRSHGPIRSSRIRSLEAAQNAGYIIAGMDIVPKDWEGLSTAEIVSYVVTEVENGAGNVILLHDGGENRENSVAAVPEIIAILREKGYSFISMSEALGVAPEVLMPEAIGYSTTFDRISFSAVSGTVSSITTIFYIVLAIGISRSLVILFLAFLRRRNQIFEKSYSKPVTVVIPAYDEEKIIVQCVRSVLASDYPNLRVIVVDDGSQDDTVSSLFQLANNPRVKIMSQLNQGKWAALNRAISTCETEIVICIDADTHIRKNAISQMVAHFNNPRIGAVAGKIIVGNRKNLLTRLQALEYITAQSIERRAFDCINGIMVVPGAIGAWRVEALHKAGLFSGSTMTEDSDMTISVLRAGYRIVYEENACAYTEAPETVRALLAQRLRWSLGMLQSPWKHKHAILERRSVGLFSIPDMVIFGYLFPLLAPIADLFVLVLIYSFFAGSWQGEVGPAVSVMPTKLIAAYLVLPFIDLIIAAVALRVDKDESMRLLWLFPFQKLFYRQLLYFSVIRALLRALTGSLSEWNKGKRNGIDTKIIGVVK